MSCIRRLHTIAVTLAFACALLSSAQTATKTLNAVFTPEPIVVDGIAESAWNRATPSELTVCMNPSLKIPLPNCAASGSVKALWSGPILYLLFKVDDPDVTTAAPAVRNRSGIQLFVDQYDDKFPKFEEDDSTITITAAGQQTGNMTNAGLTIYPTSWSYHLKSYAAALTHNSDGATTGYTIEVAWSIGDRPLKNGTRIGIDFAILGASSTTNTAQYLKFWSNGNNKGLDNNTQWGDIVLTGFDGKSRTPLNPFMLDTNMAKAHALVRGIWKDESALDRAVATATSAQTTAKTQSAINLADFKLDAALRGLRRKGKYPDPYDLPEHDSLPDPFTFFNGTKVKTLADWDRRRAEIKDLAQYYEFGYLPAKPQSLTAQSTTADSYRTIAVTVSDAGKTGTFNARLTLPSPTSGRAAPYPIIIELDPTARTGSPTYTNGGYAVLSIPTYSIASDNGAHTGLYFTLYPYDVTKNADAGVLMTWAWAASRGVDALQDLKTNDPEYANLLDLDKLVVTGFSRWGKASLVAGFLDDRFKVTAPGGSGSGGAAPYRYDSFGNTPYLTADKVGHIYPWGRSTGSEQLGDHVRHQTHNSNEMIRRFLNDTTPAAVEPRMYKTTTHGYGGRLPFDHHEEIAAIAPRAVLIDNTNDDYADNAEGDAIGYEGAMPVYRFLGVPQNLALDLYMGGGGHSLKPAQSANIVNFSNFILYGTPLPPAVQTQLTTDPYRNAGAYDTYFGGLNSMMPWLKTALPPVSSPPK